MKITGNANKMLIQGKLRLAVGVVSVSAVE
jgi:hypothetical protein